MLTRALLLALVLVASSALTAHAGPWGDIECDRGRAPGCDLSTGDSHQVPGLRLPPEHSDHGSAASRCRHKPVEPVPGVPHPEGPGGWFMVLCSPDGKDPDSHGPVWIGGGAEEGVPPVVLEAVVRERLQLPEPVIRTSPVHQQLVHLPTWLWLADGWRTVTAGAAQAAVSVTATATPRQAEWAMGDGTTVTCRTVGTPYTPLIPPLAPSPDCGHTYRRPSTDQPGDAFPVAVTVRWSVTWSGGGHRGVIDDLTTTGRTALRAVESPALNIVPSQAAEAP